MSFRAKRGISPCAGSDDLPKIRARFLAEFTLSAQSEIPSLRSGQALRCAQDDSEGLGMRACFRADENTADEPSRGREKTRHRCAAGAATRVAPTTAFQPSPPWGRGWTATALSSAVAGRVRGFASGREHNGRPQGSPLRRSLRSQRFRGVHSGGVASGQISGQRGRCDQAN